MREGDGVGWREAGEREGGGDRREKVWEWGVGVGANLEVV